MSGWLVRRYAPTLPDAEGILAVERATFGECPFTPEELMARLSAPEQHVWVAERGGHVVGFLAGMEVAGLCGRHLEADLLAVHPAWQRQGIASALLTALRREAGDLALRGVVRPRNPASEHAFTRAGFQPAGQVYDLLIYRIRGLAPRALLAWGGSIRPLGTPGEAAQLAALAGGALPGGECVWAGSREPAVALLVAVEGDRVAGGVELVEVHTLLYSGLWLEGLWAGAGRQKLVPALITSAVELAKERALDEVGCLAPQGQWALRGSLLAEGFVPLDSYRLWTAGPLPAEGAAT